MYGWALFTLATKGRYGLKYFWATIFSFTLSCHTPVPSTLSSTAKPRINKGQIKVWCLDMLKPQRNNDIKMAKHSGLQIWLVNGGWLSVISLSPTKSLRIKQGTLKLCSLVLVSSRIRVECDFTIKLK